MSPGSIGIGEGLFDSQEDRSLLPDCVQTQQHTGLSCVESKGMKGQRHGRRD